MLKYKQLETTFSFLITEKSASNGKYQLWSPSTCFNPKLVKQEIDYDGINSLASADCGGNPSGAPAWVYSIWGGGAASVPC